MYHLTFLKFWPNLSNLAPTLLKVFTLSLFSLLWLATPSLAATQYCLDVTDGANPRHYCYGDLSTCTAARNAYQTAIDGGATNYTNLSMACSVEITYTPGTASFSVVNSTVSEEDGQIWLTINRTGDAAMTVEYKTVLGTKSGNTQNYVDKTSTVSWADGDTSLRSVSVDLVNDMEQANPDTVLIHLRLTSGSGNVGGAASVTINDDETEAAIACVEAGFSCVPFGNCKTAAPPGSPTCTDPVNDYCCKESFQGDSCTVGSDSGTCMPPANCTNDSASAGECGVGSLECCYSKPSITTAPTGFVPCEGTECSFCHLVSMANTIITWLITLLFLIFAIIIAVAGFNLVTSGGNPSAKNDAKSKLVNALTGIIIVLVAWLLVDTLMRAMVGGTGEINGRLWTKVDCYGQTDTYIDMGEGTGDTYGTGTYTGTTSAGMGTIGTGNSAVVNCANVFDNNQCQYSQAKRNGCTGNPGYTDCSDLVNNCYKAAGCSSPGATTAGMYPSATDIGDASTLKPGDAVVYRSGGAGHVVICVDDGCTQVIHARGRGAPDGQPATIPSSEQITVSNSSYYLNKSGAKVLRTADYCP